MYKYFYVTTSETQNHISWKVTVGKKYPVLVLNKNKCQERDGEVVFLDDNGVKIRVKYDNADSQNDRWIFKLHVKLTKEEKSELMLLTDY